jgi:hypothetical protein
MEDTLSDNGQKSQHTALVVQTNRERERKREIAFDEDFITKKEEISIFIIGLNSQDI